MNFFYQVIDNFLSGSGFEDIVFQSGVMKSECVKGVLPGSDHNYTWIVHNVMSKPLQRLLLTRFLIELSGVNKFTARNTISCHTSPMIEGAKYPFLLVSNIFHNQKPKFQTLDKNTIQQPSRC